MRNELLFAWALCAGGCACGRMTIPPDLFGLPSCQRNRTKSPWCFRGRRGDFLFYLLAKLYTKNIILASRGG
jgi:hypothetical protein